MVRNLAKIPGFVQIREASSRKVTSRVARQSGWEGGDDQEGILTVAAD
jgi:hypothetical protein